MMQKWENEFISIYNKIANNCISMFMDDARMRKWIPTELIHNWHQMGFHIIFGLPPPQKKKKKKKINKLVNKSINE